MTTDENASTLGRARPALREPVRRPPAAPVEPPFRWQRLRAALSFALRAAGAELVDVKLERAPSGLLNDVAIVTHEHLFSDPWAPDPGSTGEGESMKRSTKRLLIGVAAGIAVYHFAIAKK